MALKSHYLPKCRQWLLNAKVGLLSPKFVFGNVEKAICQLVARHWVLIFFLLTNPKCNLGEVEKAMFQGIA